MCYIYLAMGYTYNYELQIQLLSPKHMKLGYTYIMSPKGIIYGLHGRYCRPKFKHGCIYVCRPKLLTMGFVNISVA